jgi:hypothetical protein
MIDFPRLLFKAGVECTVIASDEYAAKLKDGWTDSLAPPLEPLHPVTHTTTTGWGAARKKAKE